MFLTKRKNVDLDDNISNKNKKIKDNNKILLEKHLLKKKYTDYFMDCEEKFKRIKLNHEEDFINPYFLDMY